MTSPVLTGTVRLDIDVALLSVQATMAMNNRDMASNVVQRFGHRDFIILSRPHFFAGL